MSAMDENDPRLEPRRDYDSLMWAEAQRVVAATEQKRQAVLGHADDPDIRTEQTAILAVNATVLA